MGSILWWALLILVVVFGAGVIVFYIVYPASVLIRTGLWRRPNWRDLEKEFREGNRGLDRFPSAARLFSAFRWAMLVVALILLVYAFIIA